MEEAFLRYTKYMPFTAGRRVLWVLAILLLLFTFVLLFKGEALITIYGPAEFAILFGFLSYKDRWNAWTNQMSSVSKVLIVLGTYIILVCIFLGSIFLMSGCLSYGPNSLSQTHLCR